MGNTDHPHLPPLNDAIVLLATLPDGDYSPEDLFAMSPELGLAGLSAAYSGMKPPSRTVRFKGAGGETSLSRAPRRTRHIESKSGTTIHVRAGQVTVSFADEPPA